MLPLSQRNISTSAHRSSATTCFRPALGSGPPACLAAAYKSVGAVISLTQRYLGFTRLSVREDLIWVKTTSWNLNREDSNAKAVRGLYFCFFHLLAVDFCSIHLCGLISVRLWLISEGAYNNSVFFRLEVAEGRNFVWNALCSHILAHYGHSSSFAFTPH